MEQTVESFIQLHNNKLLEVVDSNALNQCIDLIVAFIEQALGYKRLTNGIMTAEQFFTSPPQLLTDIFDVIPYTKGAIPHIGDIQIWSNNYNHDGGHVGLVKDATTEFSICFVQNDPLGSPCILKVYNYTNILGWLRVKTLPITNTPMEHNMEIGTELYSKLVNKATQWDVISAKLQIDSNDNQGGNRAVEMINTSVAMYKEALTKITEQDKIIKAIQQVAPPVVPTTPLPIENEQLKETNGLLEKLIVVLKQLIVIKW